MEPEIKVNVHETSLSTEWFDKDGVFRSVTKRNSALTKATLAESFAYIRSKAGSKKICWIGDVTHASPPDRETRNFAAEESPKIIKALALITNSPLSKTVANFFLSLKKPLYPVKMFTDEKEAEKWIRKYLKD